MNVIISTILGGEVVEVKRKWISVSILLILLALLASGCSTPAPPVGVDFNASIEDKTIQVDAYYIDENGSRLGDVPHEGYLYFEGEPVRHLKTALETNQGEAAIIEWAKCSYFVDLWEFDDKFLFPVEYLEQSGIDLTKPIKVQLRVGDFKAEREL